MSKRKNSKVCIVIPAYNEAEMIAAVVSKTKHVLSGLDFSIVVVDDGSTDMTSVEAVNAGAIVISHILNSGAGAATATGLSYAQHNGFNIAATIDADGQHNPDDLLRGLRMLQDSDIDLLLGSRLIDSKGMSRVKILGNKGLSIITRMLFGVKVTDSQSGLRIFSERALNELRWKTNGYEFCSEMLWRASQQGLTINEYPINVIYTDYSRRKGQNNWNGINIVKSLVRRRIVEIFE